MNACTGNKAPSQPDPDGAGSLAAPISSSHYNGAGQLTAAIAPDLSVSTFQYDTLGRQTAAYRGGLVHNRTDAYAETGAWSDGSNQGLFDAERVATTVTGSATAAATWTFGGLTVGDDYGVFLTWTADAGNAEDASIKIYAGSTGTTPIWTETVDMTQAPGAAQNSVLQPIDLAAKDFQRLDGVFTATSDTIIIELSNLSATAGRMVVADTVYVVREDAIGRTVYDHAGRVWKTLDPEGYATTRSYDNLGRLVKVTQPDPDNGGNNPALVVEYAYDAAGETTHVTETNAASSFARVTKTDYDAHGRASRSVRIIGQDDDSSAETDDIITGYAYDALGRMTSQTDPLNHATSYTFDNLGRKTRETNALSGQTNFSYDIAGRMTSLTDPEENTTRWAFGIAGSVFTESINVNSVDLVRTFEYNAAGNLVRKIDRNGRVIAYGYDHLLRQTSESWYDDLDDQTAKLTYTTAYNDLGQVASIGDGATEYEYTYGLFGNLTATTQDLPGLTPDVKFAYRYDSSGRLAEVAASIGPMADYVTTYSYDRIGRITRIEQDDAGGKPVAEKRVDFDYDADGDLKEVKRYAELAAANLVARTDYVFDAIGRLTDLAHARNQITLADYDLAWDAAGRITDFDFTSLIGNAGTAGYAYDNTDQLTAADYDFQTDESYSYDENGNRTNTGYATGDHNRLSSDGTYNYTYDGEGNVTSKTKISDSTSIQYTWDHRNRLTKVTFKSSGGTATKIVEYCYDNGQRWIRKTLDTNADGTIDESQIFVHDQGQIALDFRKTGAEAATTLDLAHRYLWGPAVDQLLTDEAVDDGTADDVAWVLGDHLNSVRDLAVYDPVTQMVSVVKHVTFDAFGNVTSDSAPGVKVLFLYTARPFDPDSALQNNEFRWYDLSTGRWMSADPIKSDPNLYSYCHNSPTVYIDPTGEQPAVDPFPPLPPPTPDAILKVTTRQMPHALNKYGPAAMAQIEFSFTYPGGILSTASPNGWIIVFLLFDYSQITDCDGKPILKPEASTSVLEAWEVKNGIVHAGSSAQRAFSTDTWELTEATDPDGTKGGTKGSWSMQAWIGFVKGYALKSPPWKTTPKLGSGTLMTLEPAFMGAAGLKFQKPSDHRGFTVEWCSCPKGDQAGWKETKVKHFGTW